MHVRFERSDAALEAAEGKGASVCAALVLGPFEWVQVTYSELRIAPDGDPLALLGDDGWRIVSASYRDHVTDVEASNYFSDLVVY